MEREEVGSGEWEVGGGKWGWMRFDSIQVGRNDEWKRKREGI